MSPCGSCSIVRSTRRRKGTAMLPPKTYRRCSRPSSVAPVRAHFNRGDTELVSLLQETQDCEIKIEEHEIHF